MPATDPGEHSMVMLSDPHWCLLCASHSPDKPFKTYDGSPICPNCLQKDLSKPFPLWVKAFFAGVVVLVVVSIAWNWRFFTAYRTMRSAQVAMGFGDVLSAEADMDIAQAAVPESAELEAAFHFYRGIRLLSQDSSTAALASLRTVHDLVPGMIDDLPVYIRQAEWGSYFDEGNYPEFLRVSKEIHADSANALSAAGISSAYACMFAVEADSAYRDSSLTYMAEARSAIGADTTVLEYEQRIMYRLHAREIIDRTEFYRRFPNGWRQP